MNERVWYNGFLGFLGFPGFQASTPHSPQQLFFFCLSAFFSCLKYLKEGLKYLRVPGVPGLVVAIVGVAGAFGGVGACEDWLIWGYQSNERQPLRAQLKRRSVASVGGAAWPRLAYVNGNRAETAIIQPYIIQDSSIAFWRFRIWQKRLR